MKIKVLLLIFCCTLFAGCSDKTLKLHDAVENGNIQLVSELIRDGVDVDTIHNGCTPLALACQEGHEDCVKSLLAAGADVNKKIILNKTALSQACYYGKTECAKLLIDAHADLNAQDMEGNTALMWAIIGGKRGCTVLLLEAGADPNIRSNDGTSAMDFATGGGHGDIVLLLRAVNAR